jgi:hypothetical protein
MAGPPTSTINRRSTGTPSRTSTTRSAPNRAPSRTPQLSLQATPRTRLAADQLKIQKSQYRALSSGRTTTRLSPAETKAYVRVSQVSRATGRGAITGGIAGGVVGGAATIGIGAAGAPLGALAGAMIGAQITQTRAVNRIYGTKRPAPRSRNKNARGRRGSQITLRDSKGQYAGSASRR